MSVASVNMVENRLVGRREVEAAITFSKPLAREDLKKILAEHFKTETANVVVKKAVFLTGSNVVRVHAHVYRAVEDALKNEP
ncbi:MAG: hypothetical protein NZ570_01750, partial [Candidatus Caldarchaeum sp.]|nr:hypothetical protein [Candidatus Caldarchaeum sp.]